MVLIERETHLIYVYIYIYIDIYVHHTVYNILVADEQHCLHTVNLSLSEKWSTPNPLVYHGLSSY